jgi:hypothetical protein
MDLTMMGLSGECRTALEVGGGGCHKQVSLKGDRSLSLYNIAQLVPRISPLASGAVLTDWRRIGP